MNLKSLPLTDQEWIYEDWILELSLTYQKPKYDPYEIFNPSKTFLIQCIKGLREQCYKLLAEGSEDPFAAICNQPRLDGLNRRIREYQYKLRGVRRGSGTEITQDSIRRAKESPIQDYYFTGKLRRAGGKTMVGKCPFHDERTGSFTIYTDSNTWHCYSCGQGTDCIDLVMKTQNLTFIQAVKSLCQIK